MEKVCELFIALVLHYLASSNQRGKKKEMFFLFDLTGFRTGHISCAQDSGYQEHIAATVCQKDFVQPFVYSLLIHMIF